ncbi:S24 family peptidase [Pedobacter antarcticus]|uniref:S24 family peptidase n=1 Tax=Pedobacter antarcticus TaxID=34086 RepID=UPI001C59C276|nr:S24 family peptidase [Pedobacter antarcticus]
MSKHKISAVKAAEILGVTRQTIYQYYGSSNLTRETVNNILTKFNVTENEVFALSMEKPKIEAKPLHLSADPNDYDNDGSRFEELPDGTLRMRVPVIPFKAYAGYLRGYQDNEFYEDLNYISIDVFKQHKGHYLAFEVKGDSMTTLDPNHFRESIFDGSIAIGRELSKHQWRYKLHTHNYDAWVVVHKTEGILIKKIIHHDVENGYITIHSLNPDKKNYPDQVLFLDDVEQIFNIVQVVNKRQY